MVVLGSVGGSLVVVLVLAILLYKYKLLRKKTKLHILSHVSEIELEDMEFDLLYEQKQMEKN